MLRETERDRQKERSIIERIKGKYKMEYEGKFTTSRCMLCNVYTDRERSMLMHVLMRHYYYS